MEQNKIKAVVVAGNLDENGNTLMERCLGAFKDERAAYGEALLYLDEMANNIRGDSMVSTLERLEGDTGFGLWLKNKETGKETDYAFILFAPDKEDDN